MNTLENFIKNNLNNSKLIDTWYSEDRDKLLNSLYNKDFVLESGEDFLNEFKGQYVKRNVLNNFEIAKQRQLDRNTIKEPTNGDVFIDEQGNKFRIVKIYNGKFQFCYEGSFCMFRDGHASMSGGFVFDVMYKGEEIGSITTEELKKANKKEHRKFWFFMDNSSGAHRGLYFDCEVNVYKSK